MTVRRQWMIFIGWCLFQVGIVSILAPDSMWMRAAIGAVGWTGFLAGAVIWKHNP